MYLHAWLVVALSCTQLHSNVCGLQFSSRGVRSLRLQQIDQGQGYGDGLGLGLGLGQGQGQGYVQGSREMILPETKGTVFLMKGKARLFKEGNPLIYGGAVETVKPANLGIGDLVEVQDRMGNKIGWGFFNPQSMYRVRLLLHASEKFGDQQVMNVRDIIRTRLRYAQQIRDSLQLPNTRPDTLTNVFRLVNGEGDRLSGFVVDVFDKVVVAQASAYWVQKYKDDIIAELTDMLPDTEIVWRTNEDRLKQDGWGVNATVTLAEGAAEEISDAELFGEETDVGSDQTSSAVSSQSASAPWVDKKLIVVENGLKFVATPFAGQKTGFYCDQRENRALVRRLASKGGDVLDLYCYTGAFAVHAAIGGADLVHAVDTSQHAIDMGRENALMNGVEEKLTFEKADAVEFMRRAYQEQREYDIVIVDPPKLAPTRASLDRAANKYTRINTLALRLVKKGGLLFTFSCSGVVTQNNKLLSFVQAAAKDAQRDVTILKNVGPACCHVVNPGYPEGSYLTALLLHVR